MENNDIKYINSFSKQIVYCIKYWEIWFYTSINDQLIRFRRTKLGNIWAILTNLITITLMCLVWSTIFNINIMELYPYLMNGFVIFLFINHSISESLTIIHERFKQVYTNIPIPILSLVIRGISKELFDYLFFTPVILFVFLINSFQFRYIPIFILGFIILIISVTLICSILAILTSKFRDFVPLVKSILSVSTLLTPIFWKKEMLGKFQEFIYFNPLAFLIEIVREPLIGQTPTSLAYLCSFTFLLILYFINYFLYKYKGSRVVYWI